MRHLGTDSLEPRPFHMYTHTQRAISLENDLHHDKRKLTSLKRGLFSIILSIQFSRIARNNVKIFKTEVEPRAADEWLHRANFLTF